MPGCGPLLDATDSIVLADRPEDVELWLPSALPSNSRDTQCFRGLPGLEYQLRYDKAMGALHDIRQYQRLIKIMSSKTQVHIANTQKTATRTRSLFDKVRKKRRQAVSTYRTSRLAIEKLDPKEEFGPWKKTLLVLRDTDLRGPGRDHGKSNRSGLPHSQSWIWKTASEGSLAANDSGLDAVLRIEWCQAEERARRYEEEVELTIEDMRRTLASFECDAREWKAFAAFPPTGALAIDEAVIIGTVAYANKQAEVLHRMAKIFISDWYHLLETVPLDVPWLVEYDRPPENTEKKPNRLPSKVKQHYPSACISDNEPSGNDDDDDDGDDSDGDAAFEVDGRGLNHGTAETLQDILNDLL